MQAANVSMDPFFTLGESELSELGAGAKVHEFKKGEPIWQAGDQPDAIWLVKEGRASMVIEGAEGSSSLVHFCTKAQAFCPAAAIAGRAYPCSAFAATDLKAVAVPRPAFMKLINKLPKLAQGLIKQMAPQICDSHCSQALNVAPVKTRLATVISQLNHRFLGRSLPFTRQELANMSNTTVESAIRTLSAWEKEGVIESERGSFKVRQPEVLEEAYA